MLIGVPYFIHYACVHACMGLNVRYICGTLSFGLAQFTISVKCYLSTAIFKLSSACVSLHISGDVTGQRWGRVSLRYICALFIANDFSD